MKWHRQDSAPGYLRIVLISSISPVNVTPTEPYWLPVELLQLVFLLIVYSFPDTGYFSFGHCGQRYQPSPSLDQGDRPLASIECHTLSFPMDWIVHSGRWGGP
jgi:hypothetical protein